MEIIGKGLFKRLQDGLSKTRKSFTGGIEKIFEGKRKIDDELIEELENLLISTDIGFETSVKLIEKALKERKSITDSESFKEVLKREILTLFDLSDKDIDQDAHKLKVIMVAGVNGVGKTTTIGKLAYRYFQENKKVLIAAGDTFRAAAAEQISIWAQRANAEIIKHKYNADPSSVVYDSMNAAINRNMDILIVDTAGRLHTQTNLMDELKKIKRTIEKIIADAPHEILLVLDATTGQNALSQVKFFNEALNVTSLALVKLDGTAKGGIVLSICDKIKIPLKYIGIGEQIDDLQDFNAKQFVDSLFCYTLRDCS